MNNVSFCFIIKDGDKYLQKNLEKIINTANLFCNEYKIFYCENDSIDNTKEILQQFKSKYKNIYGEHLTLDGIHSSELCAQEDFFNCALRCRRLAYLRNNVLNKAKEWKVCNYIIMLDLDFIDFDQTEFINMFNLLKKNNNINGIFGMSVNKNNKLYDGGAVESYLNLFYILMEQKLVKVYSAFSGFGIYKAQILINNNIEYNLLTTKIEHIDFNKQINNLYVYSYFRPIYDGYNSSITFIKDQIIVIFILIFIFILLVKKN